MNSVQSCNHPSEIVPIQYYNQLSNKIPFSSVMMAVCYAQEFEESVARQKFKIQNKICENRRK